MDIGIDSLPDDLLLNVLGRLKFTEAATTALVSPRFLSLWSFSTHLDFIHDADSSLSGIHFMKFVNFILNRHRGSSVDSLRIAFDAAGIEGIDDVQASLERWVEFAGLKSVRSLEIDLHHSRVAERRRWRRRRRATGESLFLFPMHELDGMKTLTSLSLKYILIFDEDDIVNLLERSLLNLETLVIDKASGLRNLRIRAQKLKHLEISYCPDLLSIDVVSAPNLQSFHKAEDFKIKVQVSFCGNLVPKLSNVSLRGLLSHNVMLELQEHAPYLEKLELDLCVKLKDMNVYPGLYPVLGDFPIHFPLLGHVKQLVLNFGFSDDDDIMDLMFIIAACPNLQDLTLNCTHHGHPGNERNHHPWDHTSPYTHKNLTMVTFAGCCEYQFVEYLMDIATNLQMVTFDPNPVDQDSYIGYREDESCDRGKYGSWSTSLRMVQELIGNKPDSVAFRYALPRLSPKCLGVPTYENWKEKCWVMERGEVERLLYE